MRRVRVVALLLTCLALIGCQQEQLSEADKARAAAQIEAAQSATPPPEPFDLERITAADIEQNQLDVPGCSFVPETMPGGDPLAIASSEGAVVKIAGRLVTFAADVGGARLGPHAFVRYLGKAQSLRFDDVGPPGALGSDTTRQTARITVADPYDRVLWTSGGTLVCGPGEPADGAPSAMAPG